MQRLAVSLALLSLLATSAMGETATPAMDKTSFRFSAAGSQAPEAPNVNGFRLVLFYAANDSVSGFDLGMASPSEAKNQSGIAMTWGLGRVRGRFAGLASGFINIHTGEDTGVNAELIKSVKTMRSGVNVGFVNLTKGHGEIDISGLKLSKSSNVQLGFVNVTNRIDTLQIGFLNFAENGILPVMRVFNVPKK